VFYVELLDTFEGLFPGQIDHSPVSPLDLMLTFHSTELCLVFRTITQRPREHVTHVLIFDMIRHNIEGVLRHHDRFLHSFIEIIGGCKERPQAISGIRYAYPVCTISKQSIIDRDLSMVLKQKPLIAHLAAETEAS
jgi:hypothetical protein